MGRRPKLPYEFDGTSVVKQRGTLHPHPPVTIRLSDIAYAYIRNQAVLFGYVKGDARKARGMVGYLYNLVHPAQTWTDTRPEWMVLLSERLLNPEFDAQRRRGAERTPTYLFDPGLTTAVPQPTSRSLALRASLTRAGITPPPLPRTDQAPGPRHAIWWDPELVTRRRKRMLSGGPDGFPVQLYADLAIRFGIGDPRHSTFSLDPLVLAGNAVEAIGHGTLTPSLTFHNPQPPARANVRRPSPNSKEIEW